MSIIEKQNDIANSEYEKESFFDHGVYGTSEWPSIEKAVMNGDLNDKQILKDLYEACGGTWDDSMESQYNTFSSQFNGGKATVTKQELEAQR